MLKGYCIIIIVIILYLFKITYYSQVCFDINDSKFGLIEIMFIKLFLYRCNFNVESKLRRFIWCMIRLLNFSFMNTLFRGDGDWSSLINNLWYSIPLSLIFTFLPDEFVEKHIKQNYLLQLLLICEINQIFVFGYFRSMEIYHIIYNNNVVMWFSAICVADMYATCGVNIVEPLIMEKKFMTYAALTNNIYYLVPNILGYIYLNYYGEATGFKFTTDMNFMTSKWIIWISCVWFISFGFFDCWYTGFFNNMTKDVELHLSKQTEDDKNAKIKID